MKKLFVCALAASMFTACSQDETISQQSPMQISFANAFVENASRAIDPSFHNTDNPLKAFDVWGFMDEPAGVVFNNEDVQMIDGVWKTATVQYWAPEHDYFFAAIAPMNSPNVTVNTSNANELGLGVVDFNNIDGTEDLIYAAATATTKGITISESNPGKVALTFNHLLSKVKFSFTNKFPNDNAFIKVTNIKMTAPYSATINLNENEWWKGQKWIFGNDTDQTTLAFGNMETEKVGTGKSSESQYERLTIPTTEGHKYIVTFDVELFYGTVSAYKNTLQTTITGAVLEMGKAYNFHANIDASNIVPGNGEGDKLFPIEFTAEVKPWEDVVDYEGGIINTGSLPVLEGENATVVADEVKVLNESAVITSNVAVAGTLDGNGNTIFAAEKPADNGMIRPTDGAVVKNITIDGNNGAWGDKGLRAIFITTGGTYTFDNIKTEDVTYSINTGTSEAVTLTVSNSVLEGWASWGTTTTATFTNVSFTTNPDAYGMMRPQGTATFTDCTFDANFKFSLDLLVGTLTFKNCTWNGAALNAETIKSMISTDYYESGLNASTNLDKVNFE